MATLTCPHCGLPLDNLAIEQQYRGWSYFDVKRTDDGMLYVDWDHADESPEIEFVSNERRVIHIDCFSFVDQVTLTNDGTLQLPPAPVTRERPAVQRQATIQIMAASRMPRRQARAAPATPPRRGRSGTPLRTSARARQRARLRMNFIEAA